MENQRKPGNLNREKQTIHVIGYQSSIHKKDEQLEIEKRKPNGEIEKFKLYLTKSLALAKCETQFKYYLRATRKKVR